MSYLFDTDAISEVLKPKPISAYLQWLITIPREEQYTSAIVIGELFRGAFRSPARQRHLQNIEEQVIPVVSVLPYDIQVARIYGEIRAELEQKGQVLGDADLQIAATALCYKLAVVTGNIRHFQRVPDIELNTVLADARSQSV